MRKTIFLIAFASLYLSACNDKNFEDYTPLDVNVAKKLSDKYYDLITADKKYVIRQITMDQKQLRKFTAGSERVKLVAGGYDTPRLDEQRNEIWTTIIIQIGVRKNDTTV